jgi:hypothetical protein
VDEHMSAEFDAIKRAAEALEKTLYSSDKKVAQEAEGQLKVIQQRLTAWAGKNGVTLTKHVVENTDGPEVRRKCKPYISTVLDGKIQACYLVAKEGRNCLYSCSPTGMTPAT